MQFIWVQAKLFRADGEIDLRTEARTDGRTEIDMTKVTLNYRSYENAAQNCPYSDNQLSV